MERNKTRLAIGDALSLDSFYFPAVHTVLLLLPVSWKVEMSREEGSGQQQVACGTASSVVVDAHRCR